MSIVSTTVRKVGPYQWVNADGLPCTREGLPLPNEPFLGVIHMGDLHHAQSSGTNDDVSDATELFVDTIDLIIANKDAWKIRLFISPGDLVDMQYNSGNTNSKFAEVMVQLNRLVDAGIGVGVTPGNHEPAQAFIDNVSMAFLKRSPTFNGDTRASNDARCSVHLVDNGPVKLAYILLDYHGPSNQLVTGWVADMCAKYADRQVVLCTHVWVDKLGFNMQDRGPVESLNAFPNNGASIDEVKACKNIFMTLSGHFRGRWANALSFDVNNYGKTITNSCLNTQQMYSSGKNYFHVHQVYADRVDVAMFDTRLGRFLENGEAAERASTTVNTKLGYWHRFSAPLHGMGIPELPFDAPQFLQNTDYVGSLAVGPNALDMTQSVSRPTVSVPYRGIFADGVARTWSFGGTTVRPVPTLS